MITFEVEVEYIYEPGSKRVEMCGTMILFMLLWLGMRVTIERGVPLHDANQSRFSGTSIVLTVERKVMKLQDYVKYLMCILALNLGAIHCDGDVDDPSVSFYEFKFA